MQHDAILNQYPTLREALAAAARRQRLADGAVAGRVGEQDRTITGLMTGALLVSIPIDDGSLRPLHVLRPGAWLVSYPLLRGEPRRVTFAASGPTTLLRIDEPAVDALVAEHPTIWRWLTYVVAHHLDVALDVCTGLLANRPLTRIASRLLALTNEAPERRIAIELTQGDLALLSGVSRNTVSRSLAHLEQMGLIARGYRRLRVLDRDGLALVAAGNAPA